MARLAPDPKEWELEDFVSAHFTSRGCYVETCVTERAPDETLELDIVWTDYRNEREKPNPVEVKSGGWGFSEVFKFYGWTRYLGLEPGFFVHKERCGRSSEDSLKHIQQITGIDFLYIPSPRDDVDNHLKRIGLPDPAWEGLPAVWRYSYWARRRLARSLNKAIEVGVCPEAAKTAKNYRRLVNDAVFFIPDVRDRVERLLSAHLDHPHLANSAAYEIEKGNFDPRPPATGTFKDALYWGKHLPVQACMYLQHRARLYIIKALVDYWLARGRGEISQRHKGITKVGNKLLIPPPDKLSRAMQEGVEELSHLRSFRLLPVFWQTFLWSWGGFLLKDRLEEEYAQLEKETGVPVAEIPAALSAFDKIFPVGSGHWMKQARGDSRIVLMMMPAAVRGVGALRRMRFLGKAYTAMGYTDSTAERLAVDNDAGVRLLDCSDENLVK